MQNTRRMTNIMYIYIMRHVYRIRAIKYYCIYTLYCIRTGWDDELSLYYYKKKRNEDNVTGVIYRRKRTAGRVRALCQVRTMAATVSPDDVSSFLFPLCIYIYYNIVCRCTVRRRRGWAYNIFRPNNRPPRGWMRQQNVCRRRFPSPFSLSPAGSVCSSILGPFLRRHHIEHNVKIIIYVFLSTGTVIDLCRTPRSVRCDVDGDNLQGAHEYYCLPANLCFLNRYSNRPSRYQKYLSLELTLVLGGIASDSYIQLIHFGTVKITNVYLFLYNYEYTTI